MNEKDLLIILLGLIDVLCQSDTKIYSDGVVEHSHQMFDITDMASLCKLKEEIKKKMITKNTE